MDQSVLPDLQSRFLGALSSSSSSWSSILLSLSSLSRKRRAWLKGLTPRTLLMAKVWLTLANKRARKREIFMVACFFGLCFGRDRICERTKMNRQIQTPNWVVRIWLGAHPKLPNSELGRANLARRTSEANGSIRPRDPSKKHPSIPDQIFIQDRI